MGERLSKGASKMLIGWTLPPPVPIISPYKPPLMHYNDLIQLYFERSGALQGYWTLCVVIIGALLAFSSLRKTPDPITTVLVTVLYVIFAYQNLSGLHDAAVQRLAVLQAIKQSAPGGPDAAETRSMREVFEPTLTPVSYENIRNFHVTSDVLTIAALWAMELRRRRKVPTESKA